MPTDLRIVFSLRFIEGMELKEMATACDVSLATVKRRLAAAEERFLDLARKEEALRPWIEEGQRWGSR
jgi:RNA polymerase sigma-70 factor (ECF subfamily)